MPRFRIVDESGRMVVVEEKHSFIILIAMIILVVGLVFQLIYTVALFAINLFVGFASLFTVIVYLIYVFVLNHLRRKADMNVDSAEFKTMDGRTVSVRKVSSFWLTLGLVLIYVLIALMIIGLIASLVSFPILAPIYLIFIVILFIYARVLGFLRTKLDYSGETFKVVTEEGVVLEFYKERSFWITLALIFTLIEAIIVFILAAMIFTKTLVIPENFVVSPGLQPPESHMPGFTREWGSLVYSIALGITGIVLLIIAAILNFLRTRVHVKIVSVSYLRPEKPPSIETSESEKPIL